MSRAQYIFLVLLIGGMSALNPVAIDSFLPAIPDIAKELAVDPGTIGITIGIPQRQQRLAQQSRPRRSYNIDMRRRACALLRFICEHVENSLP